MAYRKSKGKSRRSKKIEPAVQTMSFLLPAGSPTVNNIDLSQCASLMNRRFYRQGINWAVAGFRIISPQGVTGPASVTKLPDTWIMANAWKKSFAVWRTMIDNATDDSEMESIKGRFLDFKIYANASHHADGVAANLRPLDGGASTYALGQWQMSDIAIPAIGGATVSDFEFVAVGPNDPGVAPTSGKNAKSLIQGYADSRALPYEQDPNVPADASLNWMSSLFREGNLQDNAVIGMLEITGDEPPYPFENDGTNVDTMYPGGETNAPNLEYHDSAFVTGTTIGGITRMRGGMFQCGLIQLSHNFTAPSAGAVLLQVDLVPGHHRGYLCESMMDR